MEKVWKRAAEGAGLASSFPFFFFFLGAFSFFSPSSSCLFLFCTFLLTSSTTLSKSILSTKPLTAAPNASREMLVVVVVVVLVVVVAGAGAVDWGGSPMSGRASRSGVQIGSGFHSSLMSKISSGSVSGGSTMKQSASSPASLPALVLMETSDNFSLVQHHRTPDERISIRLEQVGVVESHGSHILAVLYDLGGGRWPDGPDRVGDLGLTVTLTTHGEVDCWGGECSSLYASGSVLCRTYIQWRPIGKNFPVALEP